MDILVDFELVMPSASHGKICFLPRQDRQLRVLESSLKLQCPFLNAAILLIVLWVTNVEFTECLEHEDTNHGSWSSMLTGINTMFVLLTD
ncbi:hypothetical protein DITRI_Ditri09bG0141500 [Diplodiscus trichospermus]